MGNFLSSFVSGLGERGKLLIAVLVLSMIIATVAFFVGGVQFTVVVVIPLLTLIFTISKNVWSSDSAQTKVAIVSIGALVFMACVPNVTRFFTEALLDPVYEKLPFLKDLSLGAPASWPLFLIATIAILVINWRIRDPSAMNKHPEEWEKEFPERGYKEKLTGFCQVFRDALDRIEREANWSSELFVPLQAEVEVNRASGAFRKKRDLLSALRKEKQASSFLVLGNPGSGKSVALRKLCRDLLDEVDATGKVPIYVNLKEWASSGWTDGNTPTDADFHRFVLGYLKNLGDRFSSEFLDRYFDKMVEYGRVFFIFDSFDEIPALLEANESSPILNEISVIVGKYVRGSHTSRGIVASRKYKSPTNQFAPEVRIEILPFSERSVADALAKYPAIGSETVKQLLTERRDLIRVAKNPFYCALIADYSQQNNNQLPDHRAFLFASYVDKRFSECEDRLHNLGLSKDDLEDLCQRIAAEMFASDEFGFEYPLEVLQEILQDHDPMTLRSMIDILVFSKIGRHSNTERTHFTFSHKRFAEYFVVRPMIGNDNENVFEDIHNDGKWRDVLVLLAELESKEASVAMARYCWNKIAEAHNAIVGSGKTYSITAIHGLRFLRDAYQSRRECIEPIHDNLAKYIWIELTASETLLEKKIAVECVGLLNQETINVTVLEAFERNNDWISETALKSCLYLNELDERLQKSLLIYLDSIPLLPFLRRIKDLWFIVELSPLFRVARNFLLVKGLDNIIILALYIAHIFYNPVMALIYIVFMALGLSTPFDRRESFSTREVVFLRLNAVAVPLFAYNISLFINWALYLMQYRLPLWDVPPLLVIFNVFFLILPWYQVYYYLVKYKDFEEIIINTFRINRGELTSLQLHNATTETLVKEIQEVGEFADKTLGWLRPILGWMVASLVFSVIILSVQVFSENMRPYVYGTLGCLILVVVVIAGWNNVYFFGDLSRNRDFFRVKDLSRQAISAHFDGLRTERGRLRFVNGLASTDIRPTGEWPTKLPNVENDMASTRLAQLEETWRNLDR